MNTTKRRQTTSNILMVRPSNFGYNAETAKSNAFQTDPEETKQAQDDIREAAKTEFDGFVALLREKGINVIVANDQTDPITPDAVFPNNWISFHQNGMAITYPMESESRRFERNEQVITDLAEDFDIHAVFNLDNYEDKGLFLEGTGSMILDRVNKITYACLSPRTDQEVLDAFCKLTGYRKVVFHSVDGRRQPIYHTNVMMALGDSFAVICMDTILDDKERNTLKKYFYETNKEIINITLDQMMEFAGNMLQVRNEKDETFLVMSQQAFDSLRPDQIRQIERQTKILAAPIKTIETYGGGSVRCMMAEVFLPERSGE